MLPGLILGVAALFVAYTYIGYPALMWWRARGLPEGLGDPAALHEWPAITVVLAVHNEAPRLLAKLANLRACDYPQELLEIIVVSDGSTDGTESLLAERRDVKVVAYPKRKGKQHAINVAMEQVTTPLVVFCDVRQRVHTQALKFLVATLMEPEVGAVSGELTHVEPGSDTAASIGLYWRYERAIRRLESRCRATVGTSGALWAAWTALYTPLAPDTLLDDFEQPMLIARRGKRVLLDSRAIMFDELQVDMSQERTRKVRTLTGNWQAMSHQPWLLSARENPLFFSFVSHKVARLLVPYALLTMLVAAHWLPWPWRVAHWLQVAFYLLAITGALWPLARRWRLVNVAWVFVELNLAAVASAWRFLQRRGVARWEKT